MRKYFDQKFKTKFSKQIMSKEDGFQWVIKEMEEEFEYPEEDIKTFDEFFSVLTHYNIHISYFIRIYELDKEKLEINNEFVNILSDIARFALREKSIHDILKGNNYKNFTIMYLLGLVAGFVQKIRVSGAYDFGMFVYYNWFELHEIRNMSQKNKKYIERLLRYLTISEKNKIIEIYLKNSGLGLEGGDLPVGLGVHGRDLPVRVLLDAGRNFFHSVHGLTSSGADVDEHQHGGQQGQNGVELHRDAQHHALGPVVRLLGQQVDGGRSHPALGDGGEQAAQRHGQAGHKVLHSLCHRQIRQGAAEQAHAEDGEEPHHQAVQALGAGDDLKDHHLAEFSGVLAQQAGTRLTGDAGALGRADAAEHRRQARPQQSQGQAADAAQEGQTLLHLYQLIHVHGCVLLFISPRRSIWS